MRIHVQDTPVVRSRERHLAELRRNLRQVDSRLRQDHQPPVAREDEVRSRRPEEELPDQRPLRIPDLQNPDAVPVEIRLRARVYAWMRCVTLT